MFQRSYFYLVASLPELALQQQQTPFSVAEWVQQLKQALAPIERTQLDLLLLPADHRNLLNWLDLGETTEWSPLAQYARSYFLDSLNNGSGLPAYLHEVFDMAQQQKEPSPLLLEHQLTVGYYAYALPLSRGLVRQWLIFDRDLRNLLSGWNRRKRRIPDQHQVVGQNAVTEAVATSQARDFGLGQQLPAWGWWVEEASEDDLLERQQNVDRIRWNFILENLRFEYFSADVLLGYLLRLQILEERTRLDAQHGQERLDAYIQNAAEKFSLL